MKPEPPKPKTDVEQASELATHAAAVEGQLRDLYAGLQEASARIREFGIKVSAALDKWK
jgi:hypothetical protein